MTFPARLKALDVKKKRVLTLGVGAAVIAVLFAVRTAARPGQMLLFLYNLGFSPDVSGPLYDYETGIVLLLSAVVFGTFALLIGRELRPERLFPALAGVFGLFFLFTITLISVPDEVTHFEAIVELTNRLFGSPCDASIADFTGFTNHNNVCTGYLRIINELGDHLPSRPDSSSSVYEVDTLSTMWTLTYALEYLPQVLGFALARLCAFNGVTTFMLGRFFNLLFYVACLALAIRLAPRFKVTFGLAGLVPMALQQAASLSYDNFITSLSLVLFAAMLRVILSDGDKAAERLAFVMIFVAAVLLAPAKGIYIAFILLFPFIPRERFTGRITKGACFALLIAACAAAFAVISVPSLVRIMHSTPPSFGAQGGEKYTLAFFLTNPGDAFGIFKNTFNVSFSTWVAQCIGQSLSTCNLELPTWIVPTLIVLLVLSAQNVDGEEFALPRGMRAVLAAIVFAVAVTFMLTMFLTWIRNTDKIIVGVQGRYFTPVITAALVASHGSLVHLRRDVSRGLTMLTVLLLARTVLAIVEYTMFNM